MNTTTMMSYQTNITKMEKKEKKRRY